MRDKIIKDIIDAANEAKELWIPKQIAVVHGITELEFSRDYVGRNLPLLIKGACKHWPAYNKWNKNYLIDNVKGDVTVAITPDGHGDSVKEKDNQFIFTLPFEKKMKLREYYCNTMENRVYYCQFQNSSFTNEFNILRDDISELEWARNAFGTNPDAVNMWVGHDRAVSSCHRDPYENIFAVVTGTKIFTLLPPSDLPFIYRKEYPVYSYDEEMNLHPEGYSIPWVTVDPDNCSIQQYPLFQHASPVHVRVEPGDVLYLPAMWFHKVKQVGDCVAVNFWYDMTFDARFTYQNLIEKLIK